MRCWRRAKGKLALRHGVEFEDRIPVARGGGDAEDAVECCGGEPGVGCTVGQVKIERVCGEVVTVTTGGVLGDDAFEAADRVFGRMRERKTAWTRAPSAAASAAKGLAAMARVSSSRVRMRTARACP